MKDVYQVPAHKYNFAGFINKLSGNPQDGVLTEGAFNGMNADVASGLGALGSAVGGVAGALFVFGELFGFNPVWWLCLVFILAGVLGTSRMILRQHSLAQVVTGFFVGAICSILGLVYL
jgi:hypothetical protein